MRQALLPGGVLSAHEGMLFVNPFALISSACHVGHQ